MSDCIFCGRQLNNEDLCPWCGFSQNHESSIPGTLSYGTKIRNYVIGNVISVHGESTSYMAFDTNTQQKVVIKEFLPVTLIAPRENNDVIAQDDKKVLYKNLMLDFIDLHQNLKKIRSNSIPKVLEVFGENKTAYAVIENVTGTTLKQFLRKRGKPFTFKETRWMFQSLFELMAEMSKLNITHGGISDETVVITPENTIVLTGFAIQDFRTKNDHIVYKLYDGFSAPEQYNPNKFQGGNTDIYAIACLIYYCVTGTILEKDALETKDIHRILPKYAIEAIKFATKENPKERLDNIEDFVLMLDDKGTIIKPVAQKTDKEERKNIIYLTIIGIIAVIVLLLAFVFLNKAEQKDNFSSENEQSSQILVENRVPQFVGMDYSQVISNNQYQKDYTFIRLEEYSNVYGVGKISNQSPKQGETIEPGGTIYLTVSMGPQDVSVPQGLIGMSYNDARVKLDELGIEYKKEYVDQTDKYVSGMVADLSVAEGKTLTKGEVLIVYVSNDKPLATPTPSSTPSSSESSSSQQSSEESNTSSSSAV